MQESPGLKHDWLSDINLLVVRYSKNITVNYYFKKISEDRQQCDQSVILE